MLHPSQIMDKRPILFLLVSLAVYFSFPDSLYARRIRATESKPVYQFFRGEGQEFARINQELTKYVLQAMGANKIIYIGGPKFLRGNYPGHDEEGVDFFRVVTDKGEICIIVKQAEKNEAERTRKSSELNIGPEDVVFIPSNLEIHSGYRYKADGYIVSRFFVNKGLSEIDAADLNKNLDWIFEDLGKKVAVAEASSIDIQSNPATSILVDLEKKELIIVDYKVYEQTPRGFYTMVKEFIARQYLQYPDIRNKALEVFERNYRKKETLETALRRAENSKAELEAQKSKAIIEFFKYRYPRAIFTSEKEEQVRRDVQALEKVNFGIQDYALRLAGAKKITTVERVVYLPPGDLTRAFRGADRIDLTTDRGPVSFVMKQVGLVEAARAQAASIAGVAPSNTEFIINSWKRLSRESDGYLLYKYFTGKPLIELETEEWLAKVEDGEDNLEWIFRKLGQNAALLDRKGIEFQDNPATNVLVNIETKEQVIIDYEVLKESLSLYQRIMFFITVHFRDMTDLRDRAYEIFDSAYKGKCSHP
jgi:hypothetical protein